MVSRVLQCLPAGVSTRRTQHGKRLRGEYEAAGTAQAASHDAREEGSNPASVLHENQDPQKEEAESGEEDLGDVLRHERVSIVQRGQQ